MATYSKHLLSGSTGGRPIKVPDGTTVLPVTVHQTQASSSVLDEIWIYANNTSTTATKLILQFGGPTIPDDFIEVSIDGEAGLVLVIPGLLLTGDGTTGRKVEAFAVTGNVINITGYVNRIS